MGLNYKFLGERIKSARKHRGITQAQLSEKIDVSDSYISYVETGAKGVSLDTFVEIANALNTTADQLLFDSLENTIKVSNHRFSNLLNDCNEYETRVLYELLKATKEALRKNKQYF